MAVNTKLPITNADTENGIYQLDINVVSTLTTGLKIELFNPESSMTILPNSNVNNYIPVNNVYLGTAGASNVFASIKGGTANQYITGVISMSNDIYINANAITPTGNTNNVVFYDINGNCVWQPGIVGGIQTAGNVIVSCPDVNTSYRHIMQKLYGQFWDCLSITMKFSENNQLANNLYFTSVNLLGNTNNVAIINVQTTQQNTQQIANLLNVPTYVPMKPSTGIYYTVSNPVVNAAQTINMNLFVDLKTGPAGSRMPFSTL